MPKLRAIDGGKQRRADTLSSARILECPKCQGRRFRDEYIGRLIGKGGKVVHKGTQVMVCGQCGEVLA